MRRQQEEMVVLEVHAKAALPVIQSLAKGGFRVVCCSPKRLNAGFFSRYCHERVLSPSPRYEPKEFQSWLLAFLRSRVFSMVFPVGGYSALAVSEIQEAIREHTLLLTPPHSVFLEGYAKIPTLKAAALAGVPIPDTWYAHEYPAGIYGVASDVPRWPVLVKPSVGTGARGISWCQNARELVEQFTRSEQEYGESFVQDFVPPGKMQYKVDLLVDERQQLLGGVVYGKTRMYPPEGGSSVLNFSAHRPDIIGLAYQMLVQLKWVGFCDFDFIEDPRDGIPKLMEINPRFPECFRMGTAVGIDFPMMMYRLAAGAPVSPVTDYPANHFLRFFPGDALWFLRADNKKRFSTWPSWFKFFGKDMSYQLTSLDDPGPAVGYLLENVVMMFRSEFWTERYRRQASNHAVR